MKVTLKSWFQTAEYQHMAFISKDYVRFVIGSNDDGTSKTVSITIDLGDYNTGVELDLMSTGNDKNIKVNDEVWGMMSRLF